MTCTQTSTLGVYLLGALEPEDRWGFEAHLSGCDTCRSELVRLAPLPGLLNQITIGDFEGGAPSGAPVGTLEPPIEVAELPPLVELDPQPATPVTEPVPIQKPHRRLWLIAAAAAVVVALTFGGIITYETLSGTSTVKQHEVVWSATNPETGVHAEARLIERDWGTEIEVKMDNVPVGESCRLVVWAKGSSGYRETAGWWGTPESHPTAEIPASTSIDMSMIYKLEFMTDDSRLLVDLHRPA